MEDLLYESEPVRRFVGLRLSGPLPDETTILNFRHLLHGGETVVWGDAGYQGVGRREENLGLLVEWRVAMRPGRRRKLAPGSREALAEQAKAQVRAEVEHPFLRLKRLFGYAKVRYRGLAKNAERMALLFGLGNLLTAEGQLSGSAPVAGPSRPYGPRRTPTGPARGETQGAECRTATPRRQFSPLRRPNKPNAGQTGFVQSILNIRVPSTVRIQTKLSDPRYQAQRSECGTHTVTASIGGDHALQDLVDAARIHWHQLASATCRWRRLRRSRSVVLCGRTFIQMYTSTLVGLWILPYPTAWRRGSLQWR